jgi:biotin carboxyl carrier protein
MREQLSFGDERFELIMMPGHGGQAIVRIDGTEYKVDAVSRQGSHLSFEYAGETYVYDVSVEARRVHLKRDSRYFSFGRIEEGSEDTGSQDGKALLSRMPGTVLRILVEPGSHVSQGQALVILEAMKMEHEIEAPADGLVTGFPHAEGARVMPGDLLVDFIAD